MQTLDNLHEMSNPVFFENKKNVTNLTSVELAESDKGYIAFVPYNISIAVPWKNHARLVQLVPFL